MSEVGDLNQARIAGLKKPVSAGTIEGANAGVIGGVAAAAMVAIRNNNPALPWGPETDAVIVGLATALISGIWKWIRKKMENKKATEAATVQP